MSIRRAQTLIAWARCTTARAQCGAALLALLALVLLAFSWMIVSALNASSNRTAVNRADNARLLAEAKAAVIGWMIAKAADAAERNPGRLPCPQDASQDGTAAGSCDDNPYKMVGRLPWKTLGVPELRDAAGEPLWYAISPGWALPNTIATLTINSDSKGRLTVDGKAEAAVALIIAPGGPIATAGAPACTARTQQRTAAGTPDRCEYLESLVSVATPGAPEFATSGPAGLFNDQVLTITVADVIPRLEAAVATRMQRDLVPLIAAAVQSSGLSPDDGLNKLRVAPVAGVYPFAAAWVSPTDYPMDTNVPSQSPYVGTPGVTQGLLPLKRSRVACDPLTDVKCNPPIGGIAFASNSKPCTAGVDPHCDASVDVAWNVGSASVLWVSGAGAVGSGTSCTSAPSSASLLYCTVIYGRNCPSPPCGAVQPTVKLVVSTTGSAGNGFRRMSQTNKDALRAHAAGFAGDAQFQPTSPNNSTSWDSFMPGVATVSTEWQLPPSPDPCNAPDCGSAVIRLPAAYLDDNVELHALLRGLDKYSWFLRNNWHQVTYFAVAPLRVPGGSGAASLSVSGVSPAYGAQQALLVLAGRALAGKVHPSTDRTQYFEGQNASASTSTFESKAVNNTFNDRIVLVSPSP